MIVLAIGIFIILVSLGIFTLITMWSFKTKDQEIYEWTVYEEVKSSVENEIGTALPYYFFYRQDLINHILRNDYTSLKQSGIKQWKYL